MKYLLPVVLFLCGGHIFGDTLQVSRAYSEPTPDCVKMDRNWTNGDGDARSEVLWVSKEPIISEKDIEQAIPYERYEGVLAIRVSKEAEERISLAPKGLKLAFILNGKVISVAVINSKVNTEFLIEGFGDLTKQELSKLGKNLEFGSRVKGEQTVDNNQAEERADQPATKPSDKPSEQGQPSTPTPKDAPR